MDEYIGGANADLHPAVRGRTAGFLPSCHTTSNTLAAVCMNILVIEDDKRIAGLVDRGLRENGHQVSHFLQWERRRGYDARGKIRRRPSRYLSVQAWTALSRFRAGAREVAVKLLMLVLTAVDAVPKILQSIRSRRRRLPGKAISAGNPIGSCRAQSHAACSAAIEPQVDPGRKHSCWTGAAG